MQQSTAPSLFTAVWGYNAGSSYINPIPVLSQIGIKNGAASLQDGFPPNCFIPYASGGAGPDGTDFNGILQWITQCIQWNQATGIWVYSATFQAAIGGYPKGAIVQSATTLGTLWLSTVDNNVTNPDTGGAGWSQPSRGNTSSGAIVTAAGPYTITNGTEYIIVRQTVGAAITVNLPPSPSQWERHTVKDGNGDADTNNITISGNGNPIDTSGNNTFIINQPLQSQTFVWDGTLWDLI